MNKIRISDIDWDLSGEENAEEILKTLPTELTLEFVENPKRYFYLLADIADILSNKYNWCVNSFKIQEIISGEKRNAKKTS
jgi:hypothetical protein